MASDDAAGSGHRIRTMEEFAAVVGISRPTLSRFFNDPHSVRAASRARIEAAMLRFGYRPNLFAVNFNRRHPKMLGILVPSLLDPFYAGLVQVIEKLAMEAGYWTIVLNALGEPEQEAQAVTTLTSLKLAGAIVIPLGDRSEPRGFRQLGEVTPTVFLDTRLYADGPFVGTDNDQGIALMVDYLLRSGSPPVFFDMPEVNQNARERRLAYQQTMRSRGMEPRVIAVKSSSWDFERVAFEESQRFFAQEQMTDGTILCANDRIAFGVAAAATQSGLTIGRGAGNLRLAGHDDHPLSQYACPPLTTVAQDRDRLASVGLAIILSTIATGTARVTPHPLDSRLIMRASA